MCVRISTFAERKDMKTIQFRNDISMEQYQMVIRVLEALGLEVEKDHSDEILPQSVCISEDEAKEVAYALKRADESALISEQEGEQILSRIWEKWL